MAMKPDIELHIEELVLHGLSNHNAYQIGDAVQSEIARLLQEQGWPAGLSKELTIERLNARSFQLQPNAGAATVGHDIAHSVYKGLAK